MSETVKFFRHLSLSKKFALTGSLVMLLGMFMMGLWVSYKIEEHVTDNAGISTALFMDRFIAPFAQGLANNDKLSIGPVRALNEMMASAELRDRVLRLKIWKQGGLIAYSNNLEIVGKRFEPSQSLKKAWKGSVVTEFNETDSDESREEEWGERPILEIYSPIRERWSGKIIAVAEFYEDASMLQKSLDKVKQKSWLVVGTLMVTLFVSLFGIVHRGSLLIESQSENLKNKIKEMEEISEQNQILKNRVERASSRYSQLNEQYLRRIGAELHDGPAQLLALASLRLESLRCDEDFESRSNETQIIRQALDDAMNEIRNICKGLSLPEIETASLEKIIEIAVFAHEHRTGTTVVTNVSESVTNSTETISQAIKICLYRFIQEGLNNAYHHAGGIGQEITCNIHDNVLWAHVRDRSVESQQEIIKEKSGGMGLSGLRERVESLGGEFQFKVTPGEGSETIMSIKLSKEKTDA